MTTNSSEIQNEIEQIRTGGTQERREAVAALTAVGRSAIDPLIEALVEAEDSDSRWYYAVALSRIGRPAIEPLVVALREHRDIQFRRYAAAALGEMGEEAVDALIRLLPVEGDDELRGFAARALSRIGDPAIESLRQAVEQGGTLGIVAGMVLWKMDEAGINALVGMCNSSPEGEAAKSGLQTPDQRT